MCIQKIYLFQDLVRFLQVRKNLHDSCKSLARMPLHPRILQECHGIQESCKNALASKNLVRIEFFVRILQDFLDLQETCKILQEIKFLSTRADITFVKALCRIWMTKCKYIGALWRVYSSHVTFHRISITKTDIFWRTLNLLSEYKTPFWFFKKNINSHSKKTLPTEQFHRKILRNT